MAIPALDDPANSVNLIQSIADVLSGNTPVQNAAKRPTDQSDSQPAQTGGMFEAAGSERRSIAGNDPAPANSILSGGLRETQAQPTPKPERDLSRVPFPSPQQQTLFLKHCFAKGFTLPKEAVALLNDHASIYDRFVSGLADHSSDAAVKAYHAHLESIGDRIAKGDNTVAREDAWSLDDWRADYSARMGVCHNRLSVIEGKARAIALPVFVAFADFLDSQIDGMEVSLKAEANRWESPYAAPPYVWLARKFADVCRTGQIVPNGSPRAMLQILTSK